MSLVSVNCLCTPSSLEHWEDHMSRLARLRTWFPSVNKGSPMEWTSLAPFLGHHALVGAQDGGNNCQRGGNLTHNFQSLKIFLDSRNIVYFAQERGKDTSKIWFHFFGLVITLDYFVWLFCFISDILSFCSTRNSWPWIEMDILVEFSLPVRWSRKEKLNDLLRVPTYFHILAHME